MITEEQFLRFVRHVTKELKTQPSVVLTDTALERRFGITKPFRREMHRLAKKHKPPFRMYVEWTINGEPAQMVFRPRELDEDQ